VTVVLPVDVVVAKEVTAGRFKTIPAEKVPASWHIVDLGKQSLANVEAALADVRTVLWNGPLGVFEIPSFAHGTNAIARFLADRADAGAAVVVGGGDSVAAITQQGLADRMTHISTGGGASLEFLEDARCRGHGSPGPGAGGRQVSAPPSPWSTQGNPRLAGQSHHRGGRGHRGPAHWVSAAVPSGASTGINEAVELRTATSRASVSRRPDRRVERDRRIGPTILGHRRRGQPDIDATLIELDGTPNKGELGANAILGVSLACAHAAASSHEMPLYRYLGGPGARVLPVPMFNILNGGKHAQDSTDFQEFMVMPVGLASFPEALRAGAEIFAALRKILHDEGHATGQGDEGGFAPSLPSNEAAVEVILRAIEKAGYRPGDEIGIALDPAASSVLVEGTGVEGVTGQYQLAKEGRTLDSGEMVDLWADWVARYPIVSLEDGLAEEDWAGWKELQARIGDRVQLVGDDLLVTNPAFIRRGITERRELGADQAHQIGSLTESIDATTRRGARAGPRGVAPLGRDPGHDHRDLWSRWARANQDGPRRAPSGRQVQPAAPHRRGAGRRRPVSRPRRPIRRGGRGEFGS